MLPGRKEVVLMDGLELEGRLTVRAEGWGEVEGGRGRDTGADERIWRELDMRGVLGFFGRGIDGRGPLGLVVVVVIGELELGRRGVILLLLGEGRRPRCRWRSPLLRIAVKRVWRGPVESRRDERLVLLLLWFKEHRPRAGREGGRRLGALEVGRGGRRGLGRGR